MHFTHRQAKPIHSLIFGPLRIICVLILIVAIVAPMPIAQAGSAAVSEMLAVVIRLGDKYSAVPQRPQTAPASSNTQVTRLTVLIGETRDVSLSMTLNSILVVSPEIASAVLSVRGLTLTGLQAGETMLMGFAGPKRLTFMIEVVGRTVARTRQNIGPSADDAIALDLNAMSGTYSLSFATPFAGAPSLFRQTFEFQKKLSGGRTLRFSSEMFKSIGGRNERASLTGFGVGVNRMSLGIDGAEGSIDVLDSQINISPLSFNGYTMRGLHVVSTPESRLRGIELFAGQARPSLSLFDMNQGRVMGVVIPVARGDAWRLRAGMFSVSPARDNKFGGGTVWHLDGRYAPSKNLAAEAEVAYANGGVSWRARLDLQTKTLSGSGEIVRFNRRSPLTGIGAQGGGRESESLAFQWRAGPRLHTSFSYDHTAIVPSETTLRATLDRRALTANANYRLSNNSRLGFRFVQQRIETGTPATSSRFRLETRTVTGNYDLRINRRWTNSFTASLNSSREPLANAGTERGITIKEQLRYSFNRVSAVGFVHYTRRQQSLAGLIIRNPRLLPVQLQETFALDPARFLETNRDSLGLLLPGVELPRTRGIEAGLRLQKAFSKVNLAGDVRYSVSKIFEREQKNLIASVNLNLRLDAANSLQVGGSRAFGFSASGGQTSLTISYVHRFGAGGGGGMQFSRMLGLERGVIQGRVFIDLNGNGNDDADEPGVAGMKVKIADDHGATTDSSGRYHLKTNSGAFNVSLISEELGTRWRATTPTEQRGFLQTRQTVNINFGISNYGSIGGRVFNDLLQAGEKDAGTLPGVANVSVSLTSHNVTGPPRSVMADNSGSYQFRNIPPGSYTVEIERASLPADFHMPTQTAWVVTVAPLENFYLDLPLSALRSISGVVFIDKDGDGKFSAYKDETVEGAKVIANKTEVVTGNGGTYLLRNMPYGKIEVRARAPWGMESTNVIIELAKGPVRRKGVNFSLSR
jgi:hypothetical protein